MTIPPLDRPSTLRPVAAELASMGVSRVLPKAPINPVGLTAPEPVPSVVNMINQANKPGDGEGVYTSVSDPGRRGSEAATVPKDWTVTRPEPVKKEEPPPEPISKVLMDHLHKVWEASGNAVHELLVDHPSKIHELNQPQSRTPGESANEVLTYDPVRIAKAAKSHAGGASPDSTKR